MKAGWIIPMLLLATNVWAEDCTYGGKYRWTTCYGLEHAVIETVTIKAIDMIEEPLGLPNDASRIAGAVACAAFIYREMDNAGGPYQDADSALDWLVPCTIGLLYDPGLNRQIRITNSLGGRHVELGILFSLDFWIRGVAFFSIKTFQRTRWSSTVY